MSVILPRDMYDAIPDLVGNIPTDAFAVAGYVDSMSFTWSQADWDRFPNSIKTTITTTGRVRAHWADCENGDLTEQQAHDLYLSGGCLGIYCNFARWQAVQDVFNASHNAQPAYWIAEYPGGGRVLPALNGIEAVAHQYASTPGYDLSCLTAAFLSIIGVIMTDPQAIAADVLNEKISGPGGTTAYSLNDMEYWTNQFANQIPGLGDAIKALAAQVTTVQSTLAAIQTTIAGLAPAPELTGEASVLIKLAPPPTPPAVS